MNDYLHTQRFFFCAFFSSRYDQVKLHIAELEVERSVHKRNWALLRDVKLFFQVKNYFKHFRLNDVWTGRGEMMDFPRMINLDFARFSCYNEVRILLIWDICCQGRTQDLVSGEVKRSPCI